MNKLPTLKDNGYYIICSKTTAEKNPDTFKIPSKEQIDAIEIGQCVKLIFTFINEEDEKVSERMWVLVKHIIKSNGQTRYVGELSNDPFSKNKYLNLGDTVYFRPQHIIDIHKKVNDLTEEELMKAFMLAMITGNRIETDNKINVNINPYN